MMRQWGEKVLSQIKEVSMDMTGNYKSLVKKLCPNADAIVDRFHVTKMLHEELNQARIAQKKVAESLKIKELANLFNSLKGSKYTLLKAEDNLFDKQKQKLKQVKEASPLIGIMHELKEEFRFLFEPSQSTFGVGLDGEKWVNYLEQYSDEVEQSIKLNQNKRRFYQQGMRAATLLRSIS
jgi:transposase